MIAKLTKIIKEKRLPWFLESKIIQIENIFAYYLGHFLNPFKKGKSKKLKIMFICGYHGISGGVIAISNIANLLANNFQVFFYTFPLSYYNNLLNLKKVVLTNNIDIRSFDIYICDVSIDHKILKDLKENKKIVIVSCHGLPRELHGLDPNYVFKSLCLANYVHFVSEYQKRTFNLKQLSSVVIPNFTFPIKKKKKTKNVGLIGRHFDPNKNSMQALMLALKSKASEIHLWGDKSFNYKHKRVKIHGWTSDKEKIYNSFDILLSLSKKETFGMTVIEAMSCGIPAILSDIPPFLQFQDCPGVRLLSFSEINKVPQLINYFLEQNQQLSQDIISYWRKKYSPEAVLNKWLLFLKNIT